MPDTLTNTIQGLRIGSIHIDDMGEMWFDTEM
mgnify:CR=1 FL=1